MKTADMLAHVMQLLRDHNISNEILVEGDFNGLQAYSIKELRQVQLPLIKGRASYAVALHEIGHILGPWQSESSLRREAGAWKWAEENHPSWGRLEQLTMHRGMVSYLNYGLSLIVDKHHNGCLPPADHYFWECLPEHALPAARAILRKRGLPSP